MKERPILFSGPMVAAVLADIKWQTRRVMKVQPLMKGCQIARCMSSTDRRHVDKLHWVKMDGLSDVAGDNRYFDCPYGQPGDRLWVRESGYKFTGVDPATAPKWRYAADPTHADNQTGPPSKNNLNDYTRWASVPSIHMPRWASRITLEVTEVRVQQLQDISEEDAKAEAGGIDVECFYEGGGIRNYACVPCSGDPRGIKGLCRGLGKGREWACNFSSLWQGINAGRPGCGWDDNPWVWAVSFKRII